MTAEVLTANLQPVEPAYRNALRLRAAIFWGPVLVGALVLDRLVLADTAVGGLVPALVALLGLGGVVVGPNRVYRRLGYAIDGRLLRIARGWLFHTDTIVPFVRVQHIDVTEGPVDKLFGIATLVVHTAGTHNSIVTLPGLSPTRAADIREAIRSEIRADSE
ncbi:MAG: PH domain-containing protein [Sphingomonas sp.]|uniref:PH domain-containing protein n=1 Tax=Sphingomonas sp. TaxID=28214 RepID=UPI001841CAD2|nr:PH domain-containing protein [Sphingomonas sp.]MBA3666377.1 PH domain-containing protein [Sphingomonas sp.]